MGRKWTRAPADQLDDSVAQIHVVIRRVGDDEVCFGVARNLFAQRRERVCGLHVGLCGKTERHHIATDHLRGASGYLDKLHVPCTAAERLDPSRSASRA
jgi:hypothetical protein